MEDGRVLVKEALQIIHGIADNLQGIKDNFAGGDFPAFEADVMKSLDWTKKCQNKVWLRSAEGSNMAEDVLDAAKQLQDHVNSPDVNEKASTYFQKIEHLGKELSYKVSYMT